MRITLVRAWPDRHEMREVEVPPGSSVDDALRCGAWSLDSVFMAVSVFGVAATGATALHDGDRIELLRPLQLDPKQARRLRAERSKAGREP